MTQRIALVTGANRGIGLEVVRQLASEKVTVFLGARDLEKGKGAAKPLQAEGMAVVACRLDVTKLADIRLNRKLGHSIEYMTKGS